jgi:hypothetical protein
MCGTASCPGMEQATGEQVRVPQTRLFCPAEIVTRSGSEAYFRRTAPLHQYRCCADYLTTSIRYCSMSSGSPSHQGEMIPIPRGCAMTGWRRTESGRPAANIRFSTATPMAASVCWAAKPRARKTPVPSRGLVGSDIGELQRCGRAGRRAQVFLRPGVRETLNHRPNPTGCACRRYLTDLVPPSLDWATPPPSIPSLAGRLPSCWPRS